MNESVLLCIIKPRAAENFLGFDVLRAVSEGTFDKITQPPPEKISPPFGLAPPLILKIRPAPPKGKSGKIG